MPENRVPSQKSVFEQIPISDKRNFCPRAMVLLRNRRRPSGQGAGAARVQRGLIGGARNLSTLQNTSISLVAFGIDCRCQGGMDPVGLSGSSSRRQHIATSETAIFPLFVAFSRTASSIVTVQLPLLAS
jgi:hypothetical protein